MPSDLQPTGTFTKADLTEVVRERVGVSRLEAAALVDTLLEIIKSALEAGEPIRVPGFGTFSVHQKAPRLGRNPATEQPMILPGRRVLKFRPARQLRDQLTERYAGGGDG